MRDQLPAQVLGRHDRADDEVAGQAEEVDVLLVARRCSST
jgi:hypothetical protein